MKIPRRDSERRDERDIREAESRYYIADYIGVSAHE
jgi:hypothetical protein